MFQIQNMFENGKPDFVLKTAKRFDIKNWTINFNFKKNFKLRIVVLVIFNKMLVIVFNSVSFETNVPCNGTVSVISSDPPFKEGQRRPN